MLQTVFVRQGPIILQKPAGLPEMQTLEPGTYRVCFDMHLGFHLHQIEDITATGKLYGNVVQRAERVLKTFLSRKNATTGVLLRGLKGTGKSLLTRRIVEVARTHHKIPTLVIDDAFAGPAFSQFLKNIEQPAIVLCDEFDVTYSDIDRQRMLLTMLDGVWSSQKLFVACSNRGELADSLVDRPGRFYYKFDYDGLDLQTVYEYATEHLKDQRQVHDLVIAMSSLRVKSFDALKALVAEMNLHSETVWQVLPLMNITKSIMIGSYAVQLVDQKRITSNCSATFFNEQDKVWSIEYKDYRHFRQLTIEQVKKLYECQPLHKHLPHIDPQALLSCLIGGEFLTQQIDKLYPAILECQFEDDGESNGIKSIFAQALKPQTVNVGSDDVIDIDLKQGTIVYEKDGLVFRVRVMDNHTSAAYSQDQQKDAEKLNGDSPIQFNVEFNKSKWSPSRRGE